MIFGAIALYHVFSMPRPEADAPRAGVGSAASILREFGRTFVTFFRKPGILLAIVFLLLYRLPEAFLVKLINPFLLDGREVGGLHLATETVGLIYGTIGRIDEYLEIVDAYEKRPS